MVDPWGCRDLEGKAPPVGADNLVEETRCTYLKVANTIWQKV